MKTQSGRSMIEMLGVLAIIGVLSIGGLAGYTRAMRANRVNNALDFVNRCYVEIRSRGAGSAEVTCGACGTAAPADAGGFLTENFPNGVDHASCGRIAGGRTQCTLSFATDELAVAAGQKLGWTDTPTAATQFFYDPSDADNAARGGWDDATNGNACGIAAAP